MDNLSTTLPWGLLGIGLLAWAGRQVVRWIISKAQVWDGHVQECNERRVTEAQTVTEIKGDIKGLGQQVGELKKSNDRQTEKLDKIHDIVLAVSRK